MPVYQIFFKSQAENKYFLVRYYFTVFVFLLFLLTYFLFRDKTFTVRRSDNRWQPLLREESPDFLGTQ